MSAQPTTARTFYIERTGNEFKIVRVFETGTPFDQSIQQYIFQRVLATNVDERILAMQNIGVSRTPRGLKVEGDEKFVPGALQVAEIMLK